MRRSPTEETAAATSYQRFALNAPIGVFGDRFVFSATLDVSQVPFCGPDSEPWVSDGVHGTKRLLNLNPYFFEPAGDCTVYDLPSSPGPGVALGGVALFAADDLVHGRELFATDGTKEGTRLVADIDRDRMPFDPSDLKPHPVHFAGIGSDPSDLVRAGSHVFFVADDGRTGRELWISNGDRQGTRRVADFVPGRAARRRATSWRPATRSTFSPRLAQMAQIARARGSTGATAGRAARF